MVVDSGKFRFYGNERYPLYNQPDPSYHGVVFGKDCGEGAFISRLRALVLRDVGACLSPFNAFLILQGIETLSLRMRRHCDNALAVAKFLQGHPKVPFVNYPSLEGDKYHALQQEPVSYTHLAEVEAAPVVFQALEQPHALLRVDEAVLADLAQRVLPGVPEGGVPLSLIHI